MKFVFSQNELASIIKDAAFPGGKGFSHDGMARAMIEAFSIVRINGQVHFYCDGLYYPATKEILNGLIIKIAPGLKQAARTEVINYILPCLDIPTRELSPSRYVPMRTNVFDIETRSFQDYSRDHVFLYRFPSDYDPNAPDTPAVMDTIEKIADYSREKAALIWEAIGLSYFRDNRKLRPQIIIFLGPGDNGKSTVLGIIKTVVGKDNFSTLSLTQAADPVFGVGLHGRVANIGDDIKSETIRDSDILKAIVEGEPVTVCAKYEHPFTLFNNAKFYFGANAYPKTMDTSNGYFRRFKVIPLTHYFPADPSFDPDRRGNDWTEADLACMTKHAMHGLFRYLENGKRYTQVPDVVAAEKEYRLQADPVEGFLDSVGADFFNSRAGSDAFNQFMQFCRDNGYSYNRSSNEFRTTILTKLAGLGIVYKKLSAGPRGFYIPPQGFVEIQNTEPMPFE